MFITVKNNVKATDSHSESFAVKRDVFLLCLFIGIDDIDLSARLLLFYLRIGCLVFRIFGGLQFFENYCFFQFIIRFLDSFVKLFFFF